MLKLRKIEKPEELKMGMDILTVDHNGNESLDRVDCIDNGRIFTTSYSDGHFPHAEEPLNSYIEDYQDVFEVTKESK